MALAFPNDIPIAAADPVLLKELGDVREIADVRAHNAFAFKENGDAFRSVWCRVGYRNYRRAWHRAAAANLADPLADWGSEIDVDHLIARRVARVNGLGGWFVRLHPVYREINRSAGAGRERHGNETRMPWSRKAGVVFAGELQLLKALGHPVGSRDELVALFDE